jgi:hypothetical protein
VKPQNSDWEKLFQRAVGDLADYRESLRKWSPTSSPALFLEVMRRRGRATDAEKALAHCPDTYAVFTEKFLDALSKSEEEFRQDLGDRDITAMIRVVTERLQILESLLEEVRDAYQQEILTEDEENEMDLRHLGAQFIDTFQRHMHLLEQIDVFTLVPKDTCSTYIKRLSAIEAKYKDLFYLFHPLRDILARFREDSYIPDHCWWLTNDPELRPPHHKLLHALSISGLSSLGKGCGCPRPERIGAYAFHELGMTQKKLIEGHILSCSTCLDQVATLRGIAAASKSRRKKVTVPPELMKTILDNSSTKKGIPDSRPILDWSAITVAIGSYMAIKLRHFYSSRIRFSAVLRSGSVGEITLPQRVWYIKRCNEKEITFLERPAPWDAEKVPELNPLSAALESGSFWYILYGIDSDYSLQDLTKKVQYRHRVGNLPLTFNWEKELGGCRLVWLLIDMSKKDLQAIDESLKESVARKRILLPNRDPLAWLIVDIE